MGTPTGPAARRNGRFEATDDVQSIMMRHYEETVWVGAEPKNVFAFVDDHAQLSAHMTEPSWRMGGARMTVSSDEQHGQAVGSHIRMRGRVLGVPISLDEIVTERVEPRHKEWETVGEPRLLVVGHYSMDVDVVPENGGARVIVGIDYDEPRRNRWLGKLFGPAYAKWCVRQMKRDVRARFGKDNLQGAQRA